MFSNNQNVSLNDFILFVCYNPLTSLFLRRDKPPVKEAKQPAAPSSWLQRDLKVRFIDKVFKGGRYYNSKVPEPL